MAVIRRTKVKVNGELVEVDLGAKASNILMANGNTLEEEIRKLWEKFEIKDTPEVSENTQIE